MKKMTFAQMLRTSALAAAAALPGLAQAQGVAAQSVNAPSGSTIATPGTSIALPNAANVLYNQTANGAAGVYHVSQKFEKAYASRDDQIADDFTVPSGKTWTVSGVVAVGYFSSRPGTSENVFLYKATAAGLPGMKVMEFDNVKGKTSNAVTNDGTISLTLPKPVVLKAGTYFVSVQANLSLETQGIWGWQVTAAGNKTKGYAAVIRNPGNGLNSGCTKWKAINSCQYNQQGSDFLFKIIGTAS